MSMSTVLCDRCRKPLQTAVERWMDLCEPCAAKLNLLSRGELDCEADS